MNERLKNGVMRIAEPPMVSAGEYLVEHHFDSVERLINVEIDTPNFELIVQRALEGYQLIFASNHQSHADILAMGMIVHEIISKAREQKGDYKNATMPMAASVLGGRQSAGITIAYKSLVPWLEAHSLNLIPVVTEHDAESRGLALASTRRGVARLTDLVSEGAPVAIFAEASVQGGRRKKDNAGERNGIRPIKGRTLLSLSILEARASFLDNDVGDKEQIIIPVGLTGGYHLIDPDTLLPSRLAIKSLRHNRQHPDSPTHLVTATVGSPIDSRSIQLPPPLTGKLKEDRSSNSPNHAAIHHAIFADISLLVPNDERGIYRIDYHLPSF